MSRTRSCGQRDGFRRVVIVVAGVLLALAVLAVVASAAWAQAGDDVGRNLGRLLRGYATQVYGGVIAIVGVVFLVNRRYKELLLFFVAAVLVGWLVFSPDQIADTARSIGRQVL